MMTTIQISESAKNELEGMKSSEKETYENVIIRIVRQIQAQKRKQKELLIEGYKEMAEESIKIAREFEAIEEDFDWEWK